MVGAYVYSGYQHFEQIADATYTLLPATIIIAVGVFFFILGIIGCVGAFKEQKCLLGLVSLYIHIPTFMYTQGVSKEYVFSQLYALIIIIINV